ncbi:unnamed protein product [Pleuronectes platessa]|uniref:Uncharacterized protein n=1 Tax=Pleuronectes platessa TaxID=8262 RepID=A0A9N7Z041_PLEPL|nr:unnamed protein product [Pleuronectes platessa]
MSRRREECAPQDVLRRARIPVARRRLLCAARNVRRRMCASRNLAAGICACRMCGTLHCKESVRRTRRIAPQDIMPILRMCAVKDVRNICAAGCAVWDMRFSTENCVRCRRCVPAWKMCAAQEIVRRKEI